MADGVPRPGSASLRGPAGGSGERYRRLFQACPVALLEYDVSAVKEQIDALLLAGADLPSHLQSHLGLLRRLVAHTCAVDANDAAVSLLRAKTRDEVLVGVDTFLEPASYAVFLAALTALSDSGTCFRTEVPVRALDGEELLIEATVSPAPGYEESCLHVLVAAADVTQQRQSEETISALLNAPADFILLVDAGGTLLAVNDAAAERLGVPGQKLVGGSLYDVSSPSVAECRKHVVGQVVDTGRPTHYSEFRPGVVNDITVYPLFAADGAVERLAVVARDITEDVARRRTLEETQRTAAQIVQSIPSGLLVYDYEPPDRFRLAEANPAAGGITHLRLEEHRGRLFREIWPESYEQGVTVAYVRVMQTGRAEAREMAYHNADGSLSHVFRARVFRLSSRRLGVAFEDVTNERKVAQALRASEQTARALLNAPSESMILTDLEGRILDLNDRAAERLGLPREDLIGMAPRDLLEAGLACTRTELLRQVVETGRSLHYQDRRGDYEFDTVVLPVPGEDGAVHGLAIFARDVSELSSAREALAEAQRSAQQIVDSIPAGLRIFRHEPPDTFVLEYENPEAERIHGVPFEEARGKTYRELFPRAHEQGATRIYLDVVGGGEPKERLWTQYDEQGGLEYAARTHVFRLGPDRIGVAFYPVTDRLRAEQGRREMEARYQSLVESIPAVTYTAALDDRSTTTYISPQVEHLLGCSPEDYASDPDLWRQRLHPDDVERVMAAVQRAHETGERFACEYRLRRSDGRYIWTRDEAVILRDADGRPLMLQGVMLDITASREAEAALRESEQRYRNLVDSIPVGTYTTTLTPEGAHLQVSKQVEEILGVPPAEFAADPDLWLRMVHVDDRDRVTRVARRAHVSGAPLDLEYRMLARDGRIVWVRDAARTTDGGVGGHRRVQGVLFDTTARRAAEAELLSHRERLRRLNSELARVEEAERRRIAEGLHDHVGQLLVSVKMRVEALLNRERGPEDNDWLATIAQLVDEAAEATQDLTFELSPPVLYQLGLVPALEWLAERLSTSRGLAVSIEARDDGLELPEKVAILLFRSVSELLNNVAKHADTRNARVTIEAVDGEARIIVSDDGAGFDRAEAMRSERRSGGFGLFSVRERLHAVGGDVGIESWRGLGTRVTLRVPLAEP